MCETFPTLSEFVALAVQDWIARRGFKTLYIKPGSPWQNADSETFNSRFPDEFPNREAFASVLKAKVLGRQNQHWHNQERPHSSLDDQTPVEFAQRSPNYHQPKPRKQTKTLIARGCATPQTNQEPGAGHLGSQILARACIRSAPGQQSIQKQKTPRRTKKVQRGEIICFTTL